MDSSFSDCSNTPSPDDPALVEVLSLATKARQFDGRGSYYEAERLFNQAIELAESLMPPLTSTLSDLWNSLGEVYLHIGRLEDAEQWFNKALDLSVGNRDFNGITASRDYLARLQRIKEALLKAKALQMLGAPDDMRCDHNSCVEGLLRSPQFSICGGCKRAFYCSVTCQRADWERHKRHCLVTRT